MNSNLYKILNQAINGYGSHAKFVLYSAFQIKIYFLILSMKKFECDRGNFEYIVFIFLFIYLTALC